jgi:hypothetical protein
LFCAWSALPVFDIFRPTLTVAVADITSRPSLYSTGVDLATPVWTHPLFAGPDTRSASIDCRATECSALRFISTQKNMRSHPSTTQHSFPAALWTKYFAGRKGNDSDSTHYQDSPYSGFSDRVASPTYTDIVFLALGAVPIVSVGNASALCTPPQYSRPPSGCLTGRPMRFETSSLSLGLAQWTIFGLAPSIVLFTPGCLDWDQ